MICVSCPSSFFTRAASTGDFYWSFSNKTVTADQIIRFLFLLFVFASGSSSFAQQGPPVYGSNSDKRVAQFGSSINYHDTDIAVTALKTGRQKNRELWITGINVAGYGGSLLLL